jgi:hypothetical protein
MRVSSSKLSLRQVCHFSIFSLWCFWCLLKTNYQTKVWYNFILRVAVMSYLSILLFVSYVSCLLSFVICVCMLCCFCYWPIGCWLVTLVNKIWIEYYQHSGQVVYLSLSPQSTNFQIIWFVHGLSTFWLFIFKTMFKAFIQVPEYHVI